jgi:hypothetical protein
VLAAVRAGGGEHPAAVALLDALRDGAPPVTGPA